MAPWIAEFRGTTFLSAFVMQSVVTALALIVGLVLHESMQDAPRWVRVHVVALASFVSCLASCLALHMCFGYGACMVDSSTRSERLSMRSLVER